jgi:hypothetical protein
MATRDVAPWCIVIKPELEKMEKHPKMPVTDQANSIVGVES